MAGLFIQGDVKNQNGRIYPKGEIKQAVESVRTRLTNGETVMGELDHPESSVINLQNVSHNVVKCWWDGDDVMGDVEILPTPAGNILKALFGSGITIGISSRGMGSLKQMGEVMEVQDDFELICFDLVSSPSTPGAYLFANPEDRLKYEENLDEEKIMSGSIQGDAGKSIDLMKKLSDYLDK